MRNIRDLKYLITLAELGSFSRAAEACFVSQPTLSAQLKKLEEDLGVTLFERTNKQVLITSVGKQIADKARLILQNCNDLKTLAENAKDPFSGAFRLGIIPTLGPYLLPEILKPLQKTLPNLALFVHEDKTDVIMAQLKSGELDAIILALPVPQEGLHSTELFCEPFCIAAAKNNPLLKKKSLSLKDLQDQPLLLLSEGHCFREQALEACARTTTSDTGFRATSLETLRQLVAADFGITLLPALSVYRMREDAAIGTRDFEHPIPSRRIGMLWRHNSAREKCCEKIAALIQAEIKELPFYAEKKTLKVMKKIL